MERVMKGSGEHVHLFPTLPSTVIWPESLTTNFQGMTDPFWQMSVSYLCCYSIKVDFKHFFLVLLVQMIEKQQKLSYFP